MKRICAVLLLFLLVGCAKTENPLAYQERCGSVSFTVTADKTVAEITLTASDGFSVVTVDAPAELAGITFRLSENEAYAECKGVSIPVAAGSLSGIALIPRAFTLKPEERADVSTVFDGETRVTRMTFETEAGTFTVDLSDDGFPVCIVLPNGNTLTDIRIAEE